MKWLLPVGQPGSKDGPRMGSCYDCGEWRMVKLYPNDAGWLCEECGAEEERGKGVYQ